MFYELCLNKSNGDILFITIGRISDGFSTERTKRAHREPPKKRYKVAPLSKIL